MTMKIIQTEKYWIFFTLILSVSTTYVERAFSTIKIIKTKLRNKINNVWL